MDRLPDEIISHITSFLPLKMAARTSVLSKRWRNLFTFSSNLDLFENDDDSRRQSFIDFVDRVLAVSRNSSIKRFTLGCDNGFDPSCINRWICNVLNRGVLVLDLNIDPRDKYSLPFEVFTCKTIVELQVSGLSIDVFPEDAFLPSLKILHLRSVSFHVCAFEKIISACLMLEDLSIHDLNLEQWKCSHTLTSPTLQRLTLSHILGSIAIDTPNLTYLHYHDFVADSYPVFSSLNSPVEANLCLVVSLLNDTRSLINLIKGLRNVEILRLSAYESLEMLYFVREAIPVFENLFQLSITTHSTPCWRGLISLLNKSPNLETLIIEGPLHYDRYRSESSLCECLLGYSFLWSCPVKVLKITEYSGTIGEARQLKHLLGKLSCLELLKVRYWGNDKLQITRDLLTFPRASSKCESKVE